MSERPPTRRRRRARRTESAPTPRPPQPVADAVDTRPAAQPDHRAPAPQPQTQPPAPHTPAQQPPAQQPPSAQANAQPNRRRRPPADAERGLRDLVGAGPSQLGVDGALRARDVNRPTADDLADAERTVTIVRRNWQPPSRS